MILQEPDPGSQDLSSHTMVEIAPTAQGGEQQYAIVYVPQGEGEAEPVSEAALSMLQLQSSGGQ